MRLGILVKSLGTSQEGLCLINELNKLSYYNPNSEIIVFYDDYDKIPLRPKFPIMLTRHAWNYDGSMLATNYNSVKQMLNFSGPIKKYFYIWNLDWIYFKRNWKEYEEVYQNNSVELITRSKYHAEIVEKLWKPPLHIMENFDYAILEKL